MVVKIFHQIWITLSILSQKQSSRGFHKKRCSENVQQISRRTPMPHVISINLLCNFIEIALRHGCFPVHLLHFFRTPFPRNTSEWSNSRQDAWNLELDDKTFQSCANLFKACAVGAVLLAWVCYSSKKFTFVHMCYWNIFTGTSCRCKICSSSSFLLEAKQISP